MNATDATGPLSVAVALSESDAPGVVDAGAWTCTAGDSVSGVATTVIECDALPSLPLSSTATARTVTVSPGDATGGIATSRTYGGASTDDDAAPPTSNRTAATRVS